MKNKLLLTIVTAITLLSISNANFGQAPNLGTAANFVLFTSVGAVGNTGISQLTGNIGTNTGAITGFGNVNGVMHNTDAATAQAAIDLQAAWYYLDTLTPTSFHAPVYGGGETLFAGVDTAAAAASIVGILNLDAQGDSSALFIIKTGGALTTAATASVVLKNGAQACNVFWVAEGAIGLATLTIMKGNLISHNGAISVGAGCNIEGRALSTTGSVTVYGTNASIPVGCSSPILIGPIAPPLNRVACFALFSSGGVVLNSGITHVTGDVGTNHDSTTGFNALFVTGSLRPVPDKTTAQCEIDLLNVFTYLISLPFDIELLYPAQFGSMLVLTPHVYLMNAATTLTDTVYLDAQGNTDAVFVIQIIGALSTSAYSKVSLINGTQAKNVFWVVEGAVTISDNSVFCGTIVSHDGAIVLSAGVILNGRALTTLGAVTTTGITANNFFGGYCVILPIGLQSFTGVCDKQKILLSWNTASESNNKYFTVERKYDGKNWQAIGTVNGAGGSHGLHYYSFTDVLPGKEISYYRIKQTDFDGNNTYGAIIHVKKCGDGIAEKIAIYPNPSTGKFDLVFTGDQKQVYSIEIFNALGAKVYRSMGFHSKFDLSDMPAGVYYLHVQLNTGIINLEIVIKK